MFLIYNVDLWFKNKPLHGYTKAYFRFESLNTRSLSG